MRARPLALAALAAAALLAGCSSSGSAPATATAAGANITINVSIDKAGKATVDPLTLSLGNPPEQINVRFTSHHQPPKGLLNSCPNYDVVRVNADSPVALLPQDGCHTYEAIALTRPTVGTNVISLNGDVVGSFQVMVATTAPKPTKTP
ncbi:MAG TPA: hypothetical protein VMT30_00390 [Candidatus Saccharimonadia bacterium]|nr:hypothetical protein [Candidatus Saccharimonadia bacterium]